MFGAESRELDFSVRSVSLWCCQGFGMAESSQDMRVGAIALWLSWGGLMGLEVLLVRE